MTFYEAAIEVLRDEGRPLHFKKITAHAIKRNLLSHVGRTPEDTMEERLSQETKKPESDSLIRSVRPGVFTLVEGADIEEARQTVSLRDNNAEADRRQSDSEAVAKKILDQQNSVQSNDSSSGENGRNDSRRSQRQDSQKREQSQSRSSNNDRSSNQRSDSDRQSSDNRSNDNRSQNNRQSGDNRSNDNRSQNNRQSGDNRSNDSRSQNNRQSGDNRSNDNRSQNNRGQSNRQSNDSRSNDNRSQNNRGGSSRQSNNDNRSQIAQTEADSSSRMGDIAEHIAGLMDNSGAMTLEDIVKSMKNTTWASIDEFGPVAIRNILIHANETSGDAGQPPRFFELNNHRWTLAQASDKELGKSYDALEEWQVRHRSLLLDRLSQQLLDMNPGRLSFTVGLIMERLGYEQITDGKKVGNEIANLVGNMEQGFANERIVIRVLSRGDKADEQSVISFRGSLNLYRADRGILICLDGFDGAADQHKRVDNVAPISLVSVQEVARLMLKTNVGVCLYEVSTACMDDAFFAS